MQNIEPEQRSVAIYARVSTQEQREGQTIDSQVTELERFAAENGWRVAATYKDDGWSGGAMARPALDQLRDDARRGRFQAVLINDVDRLARDVTHLGVIKRDLEKQGVRVVFRKLPAEESPTYNLMVNILGSFAEFERELIADRTRRGRKHKIEVRKEFLGSQAAYGYRYLKRDRVAGGQGMLTLVPEEAAVVQQMYAWVDQEALTARTVVRRLNQANVPARSGATRWGRSSVLRVLHNEMYAGVWHYNKYEICEPKKPKVRLGYRQRLKSSTRLRPRSQWLPWVLPESLVLVSRERWERVQRQLTRNSTFSPRNEKHRYLLKGLIQCGGCKARYVGDPHRGKFYYRCANRCKRYPTIRDEILDAAVLQKLEDVVTNPTLILKQAEALNKQGAAQAQQQQNQADDVARLSKNIQHEEDRILEAYRTGLLSPVQLGAQLEQLKTRRLSVQARSAALSDQPAIPLNTQAARSIKDYCEMVQKRLHTFTDAERRQFVRAVIRNIVFEGNHVRIQGEIPAVRQPDALTPPSQHADTNSIGIVTREVGSPDLNSDSGHLQTYGHPRFPFELPVDIVKQLLLPPRDASGRFNRAIHG